MTTREPIFNVPGVLLAALAALAAVHAARFLFLSPEADAWLVFALAFIPARYTAEGPMLPGGKAAAFTSFVTHLLVHSDIVHLAFNSAWLLVFGTIIAKRVGSVRYLAFGAFTGAAGALAFLVANPGLLAPLVGASGSVAGLMGGTLRFLFPAVDAGEGHLLREAPERVPLMPLGVALRDRRILLASAAFVFLNLLAMVGIGGAGITVGHIAWEAHLGGYFVGLLSFGLFDRPAVGKLQPIAD